jgi:rare lipoprotein A
MRSILPWIWLVPLVVLPISAAHAEMMLTSYYRAKAPHIAAHRTLPLGTQLIITNPRNGRSTSVVIGTRGPFTHGRHLDISHEFAMHLDFERSGVAWLETRVVAADTRAAVDRPQPVAGTND